MCRGMSNMKKSLLHLAHEIPTHPIFARGLSIKNVCPKVFTLIAVKINLLLALLK